MKKTNIIKTTLIVLACLLGFGISIPTTVYADDPPEEGIDTSVCDLSSVPEDVKIAAGCDTDQNLKKPEAVVGNIIQAVVGMLGIVAIIMIIYGGVNYMTSAGDPGKTKKAKDIILYACIGLIICVLAFAITNFVIRAAK